MDIQKLTREQLEQIIEIERLPDYVGAILLYLWDENLKLKQEVTELRQEVKELKDRLNQNSRNSSKPPSSDGYKKPNPQSLRGKSGKQSGGQPGHPGYRLEMKNTPDHTLTHSVCSCKACGHLLTDVPVQTTRRRQMFEIVARMEVTEHRTETKICPSCHGVTEAAFPAEVPYSVQYGSSLKAFASYGSVFHFLPSDRLRELLFDLTGHNLSAATLYHANDTLFERLLPFEEAVKERLLAAPVVHFDESGLRVEGKNHWLHVACTGSDTYYTVHKNRGQIGMNAAGILSEYNGNSIHDGLPAYWKYNKCKHGLCNVHHERELVAVTERTGQPWAKSIIDLFHEVKKSVEDQQRNGHSFLGLEAIHDFSSRYDALIQQGLALNPPAPKPLVEEKKRGRVKQSTEWNLLNRLDRDRGAVLLFMHDFRVPYTNNQAEQDVRMIKVQQKVSGSFRTLEGAKKFCRIRGYISTLRKKGHSVLEGLRLAFDGNPVLP